MSNSLSRLWRFALGRRFVTLHIGLWASLAAWATACASKDGAPAAQQPDGQERHGANADIVEQRSRDNSSAPYMAESRFDDGHSGIVAASSWTYFGRDFDNTQDNPDEVILSPESVVGAREIWRFQIPDGSTSTPVVDGGFAYFGGWDGFAYAVDAATGELQWRRRIAAALARSTPLVTKDRVYLAGFDRLSALDRADGSIVFQTVLDTGRLTLIDSSPKLVDDLLLIGVASGDNTVPSDHGFTFEGSVVAVDSVTGEIVWRVPTTGQTDGPCRGAAGAGVWSSAAIDPELGLAFFGTGQGYAAPASTCSDSLLAIHYHRDYQGERVAWVAQYTDNDVFVTADPLGSMLSGGQDADIGASPNLFAIDGVPVVGAGDKNGSYRVFERKSGRLVWRKDLDADIKGFGGIMTTAGFHDGTLFVASNQIRTTDYVLRGTLNPQDNATVYALDASTGEARWTMPLASPMVGGFAIANGLLYHATMDGTIYARLLDTGEHVWMSKTEGSTPGAGPSIVDGRLYISAGMVVTGASDARGGIVSSFGLGPESLKLWKAPEEPPDPLSVEECRRAEHLTPDLSGELSQDCASCLCECDPTAAGHCDRCTALAPCVTSFCWFAEEADMRACMESACSSKLLTTYLFDRAVDAAPCLVQCASRCDF